MVWANSGLQLFEGEIQRWQKLSVVVADSFARGNSSDVQRKKFQLDITKKVFTKSVVQLRDRETDSILGGFQDSARQSHCWRDQPWKNPPSVRQVDWVIFRGPSNHYVYISVIHSLLYYTVISPAVIPGYLHFPAFLERQLLFFPENVSSTSVCSLPMLFSDLNLFFSSAPPPLVISSSILTCWRMGFFWSSNSFKHLFSMSSHLIGVYKFQVPAQPPLYLPLPSIFISLFHQSSSCSTNPQIFSSVWQHFISR